MATSIDTSRQTTVISTTPIVPITVNATAHPALEPLPSKFNTASLNSNTNKPRPLPTAGLVIPDLPIQYSDGTRSTKEESWRIIIQHWQRGDPERGLLTPLKDWPAEWTRGKNRIFHAKRGQREDIALEFLNVCVLLIHGTIWHPKLNRYHLADTKAMKPPSKKHLTPSTRWDILPYSRQSTRLRNGEANASNANEQVPTTSTNCCFLSYTQSYCSLRISSLILIRLIYCI